ncbi:hypothetical protein [Paenibacillus sp. S150]|uniref:hypothetical protein n=1 Tax=Paenibacillus sp. S150 TaxID=2749826 RepID=UPI001C585D64|nr:hypothetical protein [Paenibacillus sp. S150]MBW4085706.1 hypothetical protein [Paenibacillus sp. S150]
MNYTTKYAGLDVSKETIAVAVAESGRDAARYVGAIKHEAGAIRKLLKQLGKKEDLEVCYEAGPAGCVAALGAATGRGTERSLRAERGR